MLLVSDVYDLQEMFKMLDISTCSKDRENMIVSCMGSAALNAQ